MSIWNKVLIGLISVASVAFFYLAARALKMQQNGAEQAMKYEQRIKEEEQLTRKLLDGVVGDPTQPPLWQAQADLHRVMLDRRRVWEHCDPKIKLGDDAAEITVTFAQPVSGLTKKTVLYAFEEADVCQKEKGRYVGDFIVTAVEKQKATLVSAARLTSLDKEKLTKLKQRPWVLYDQMPRDGHDMFATISDEQKKAMFAACVDPDIMKEYLKDGKPTEKGDPADRVIDGKYVRLLRDYNVLFDVERSEMILLQDSIESAKRDKQLVVDALALAREMEEGIKRDIAATVEERNKVAGERDAVASHHERLQKALDATLAEIAQLLNKNKAMVGQIAKFQLEAAERIDQRTRAMAQSGSDRF